MKKKIVLGIAAISFATVLFTSCAKMPQVEIDAAKAAVEEAKVAQAEMYVPEAFVGLQDTMKAAMESIEAQESKWFKNYDDAKAKLAAVITISADVKVKVEARKVELKNEIDANIAAAKEIMTENATLFTKAPKGKEGAAALLEIKSEMATIETSIGEAEAMLATGDLINTSNKAKAAKDQATAINEELKAAIEKKGKK
jgi:hypothetical protein